MIIAIVGNIGSGKSLSMTRRILHSKNHCFVNFDVKTPNSTRIRKEHVITEEEVSQTARGKPIIEKKVNWQYWNEQLKTYKNYNICLDEIHNLVHSRQSMTKWNTLLSIWISQIRKILGEKEKTHIYIISQRLNRIDKSFRDLLHMVIYCEKIVEHQKILTKINKNGQLTKKLLPVTWIIQYYFIGENAVEDYLQFKNERYKTYIYKTRFLANKYYHFYNTSEIFGETPYL